MITIWHLRTFDELSTTELYTILQLRQEIFVVEQNCPYLDCDDKDQKSHHLLGWHITSKSQKLTTYLRILPPTPQDLVCKIGRVLCHPSNRGTGIGKELMARGISECGTLFPLHPIHISAQLYLLNFYTDLGFSISSTPYDEDGIPHIGMMYTDGRSSQSDDS